MTRFAVIILTLSLCASAPIAVSGCSRAEREKQASKPPAAAFHIGIAPVRSILKQIELYEPFTRYLSSKTGMDVRLTILPKYESTLNGFISQKADVAFFSSFAYVLAHARLGAEVLARPVGLDGASTRRGLIFVRKDSGIRSVRDMQGKRFAFVGRGTTGGYLLPLAYLKKAGVPYRNYLGGSYFIAADEDAVSDVLDRKADISVADNAEFERLAAKNEKIRSELLIVARSPDVPESSLAVRKDLDEALKIRLKAALLNMHEDNEGAMILLDLGIRRFIDTSDNDFKPVYEYAHALGLNLRVWDGRYLP